MPFRQEYFSLQLAFAAHIAHVIDMPLESALLHYTPMYLSLGLDRSFDPENERWRAFIARVHAHDGDAAQLAHHIHQKHSRPPETTFFGCFYYTYKPDMATIRIHFEASNAAAQHPLSAEQVPHRRAELSAMFAHIHRHINQATTVQGGSWLYSLESYRQLFPAEFLQTATEPHYEFQFLSLWGQFLNLDGDLRPHAQHFLDNVRRCATISEITAAFPFAVLRPRSSIEHFYRSLDIQKLLS